MKIIYWSSENTSRIYFDRCQWNKKNNTLYDRQWTSTNLYQGEW